MKFKYVNPKVVEEVMGKYALIDSYWLSCLIDEALNNTNQGYIQTTANRRYRGTPQVSGPLSVATCIQERPDLHSAAFSTGINCD